MDDVPAAGSTLTGPSGAKLPASEASFSRDALLIGAGWLGTGLCLGVHDLPFKYLLKEQLKFTPEMLAGFMALSHFPIYIKPLAGILTDAVPLLGTRRRGYLVLSLLAGGLLYLLLALIPRSYGSVLAAYVALQMSLTMTSTVLGGLMVEVGKRANATGRLSAQRLGITRFVGLISGPLGGLLARQAFIVASGVCALLQWVLVPLYLLLLREPKTSGDAAAVREVSRQFRALVGCRPLWAAAGLVILVIASPGFGIPLFYYQTDTLKFSPLLIGNLEVLKAVGGMLGAFLYGLVCRRFNLRVLLGLSIAVHAGGTLFYLAYHSPAAAAAITAIAATTEVLALLPLYDLAARATPKGSEALGYSLMMSVWNFTNAMSDLAGAWLYDHLGLNLTHLVWVNVVTTLMVLPVVPLLPKVLMNRKDGDAS